jgi:glycosyltransferase involved in cell wall biosynthesis
MIRTVSIIIPTLNEEGNLPACLDTIAGYFEHVHIVDSVSTDRTLDIARERNVPVMQNRFEGYATQFNWALDNLPLETDWVIFTAADERYTPELRDELAEITADGATSHVGFYVPQRYVFLGRLLEHGGWAPSHQLRLFRRSAGRFEERAVHEYPVLDGTIGYLKNHYVHHDSRDIAHFVQKHNRYSTLEAEEAAKALRNAADDRQLFRADLFGDAMERRRWIKQRVWPRLPGRFLVKFGYQYIVRGGFRDGRAGYYFALLHAFYEALIAAKTYELMKEPAKNDREP